jgi:subtilase family serine protease
VSYNAAVDGGVIVAISTPGIPAGFYIFGGTSAGSPQMAGVFALANQARGLAGKGKLGYINPTLYSIAESSAYSSDFHDITVGNDQLVGTPTSQAFSAHSGYDIASGWGTPNVANLISSLVGS